MSFRIFPNMLMLLKVPDRDCCFSKLPPSVSFIDQLVINFICFNFWGLWKSTWSCPRNNRPPESHLFMFCSVSSLFEIIFLPLKYKVVSNLVLSWTRQWYVISKCSWLIDTLLTFLDFDMFHKPNSTEIVSSNQKY